MVGRRARVRAHLCALLNPSPHLLFIRPQQLGWTTVKGATGVDGSKVLTSSAAAFPTLTQVVAPTNKGVWGARTAAVDEESSEDEAPEAAGAAAAAAAPAKAADAAGSAAAAVTKSGLVVTGSREEITDAEGVKKQVGFIVRVRGRAARRGRHGKARLGGTGGARRAAHD